MNRFERDDLDWVMGELAHALGCAQNAGKSLYEHDPALCAEILEFFGEWQQAMQANGDAISTPPPAYTPPPVGGRLIKRWIAWNAIQWIRSA